MTDKGVIQRVAEENELEDEDTCVPCMLPCQKKMRPCKHPCKEPCHLNTCPPCEISLPFNCYCDRIKKFISCWQTFDKELLSKLRSCGTKCGRPLEFCSHICDLPCHPPKCPSEACTKKVTLRCKCNTLKQVVPCNEAREEIKKLNLPKFKYNILPCDPDQCKKQETPNEPEINEEEKVEEPKEQKIQRRREKKQQIVTAPVEDTSVKLITKSKKKPWYQKRQNIVVLSSGAIVFFLLVSILWLKNII